MVAEFLDSMGYREAANIAGEGFTTIEPGTYVINSSVPLAMGRTAFLPVDVFIQPIRSRPGIPVLVDLGSFRNNRESARFADREIKRQRALQMTYGNSLRLIPILAGHIDPCILPPRH